MHHGLKKRLPEPSCGRPGADARAGSNEQGTNRMDSNHGERMVQRERGVERLVGGGRESKDFQPETLRERARRRGTRSSDQRHDATPVNPESEQASQLQP